MPEINIEIPNKLVPIFDLTVHAPYRGAYGGRGSAKTKTFAKMLALAAHYRKCNALVAREIQASIKDSSHAEIKDAIESDEFLNSVWECGVNYIKHRRYSTEFIFRGLKNNIASIKSLANIGITWVDEADPVSENSWSKLIPTVMREPNSEIWLTWNREVEDNATDKRFIKNPPEGALIVEVNHKDNPWFPDGLERERKRDLKLNPDTYAHIWEGDYLRNSDAEIFNHKWRVDEFEPKENWQPYYGLDFGFSQDPTAAIELYVHDNRIYVRREAGKVGLEVDETGGFLKQRMPGIEKHHVQADSARPETISFLKRNGLPLIRACTKWPGSVEEGITFIRGHIEIVIHPECMELIKEAKLYRYKVDQNTGDVTTKIVDAHNHYWDAVRYALDRLITNKNYKINL